MITKRSILALCAVDIFVIALFFSLFGVFAERTDTQYFVAQINNLRGAPVQNLVGLQKDLVYFRGFKPLYSFSGLIFRFLSPRGVILLLNILFLFGLSIFSYYFFRLLEFEERLSFWGSVWISTSYPMFKYGLALVTDISGWFFTFATMVLVLHALKNKKSKFLLLASLLAFLGALSKETGVLGIVFGGVYALLNFKEWGVKDTLRKVFMLSAPFLALYGSFAVVMHYMGAPSFIEWYKYNFDIFFHDFYKLRYFLSNEFLSLHVVYIFSLIGLFFIIKNKEYKDRKLIYLYLSLLVPSVLVFCWPVFYYRILFIQCMFFVPLALHGFSNLDENNLKLGKRNLTDYLVLAPPIVSIILSVFITKM